jgi:hypothetical protein
MALSIRVLCSSGVSFIAMMSVILSFAGCRSTIRATGETPPMGAEASGRLPAAAFFRAPLLSHVTLSPDGRHIAAIFAKAGTETLMVRPSSGGEVRPLAKLVRSESSQSIRSSVSIRKVGWGSNERILVSVEMPLQNPYVTGIRARQSRLIVVELLSARSRVSYHLLSMGRGRWGWPASEGVWSCSSRLPGVENSVHGFVEMEASRRRG